jgi:hypothetical protein
MTNTLLSGKEQGMEERSRIKFNPATKEIEVEGSETFVKTYFSKIQKLLAAEEESKPVRAARASSVKRGDIYEKVMGIINDSTEGINTPDLMERTGLTSQQIRSVIYRAEKQGKIQKAKRGLYAPV